MRIKVLCLALFALISPVSAGYCGTSLTQSDKPIVYNCITPEGASLDQLVHRSYETRFRIIDIASKDGFIPAKVSTGTLPEKALSEKGQDIAGYVLAFYLINDQGQVTDPIIVKSTDKQLNRTALKAMAEWRFIPATLRGKNVWSTAAQEFTFRKRK